MAFEKFTKTRGRGYSPKVSIWSKGQIGFNEGSLLRFSLKQFEYVVLFYDKENRKIGIRFTNEKEDGIVKFIKRKTGGASISAKAFLDFYNIRPSENKKYDVYYNKDDDLYIINV
jgi:hypothetical protein